MGCGVCAGRPARCMPPVIKPTALVSDDSGFLKDGDAWACVARRYTGTADKVSNCQAGASLHLASNGASAAVNWRLFLSGSWDPASPKADPAKVARRDKCAVPAEVGGRSLPTPSRHSG
ncbi:transposase [Streptomyces filamentosus NRRL 11379]|nr:transposase [Streptomyces filamentosus NRRL 11379]